MKFTIAIPAYKSKYLHECIESILNQTLTDFELVIVNDASPENLDKIISAFNDKKIKYIKNDKNCGALNVVDNWNICLSHAKGDFITLMGDDDVLSHKYLEELSKLIAKYPNTNVYHCRSLIIDENSTPIRLTEPRPEYESVYDLILERIKFNRTQFIGDFCYRTEWLRKNNGYYKLPLAWGSDDITSYQAASKYGIAHSNIPLFKYRESSISITSSGSHRIKLKAIIEEHKWLNSFLRKTDCLKNEFDEILKENIYANLSKYLNKRKQILISQDILQRNSTTIFHYIIYKKQYNISYLDIANGILLALKKNIEKKPK